MKRKTTLRKQFRVSSFVSAVEALVGARLLMLGLFVSGFVPSAGFASRARGVATRRGTGPSLRIEQESNASISSSFQPHILYESERILAIRKPAGIAHHDDDPTDNHGALGIISQLRLWNNQHSEGQGRLYGVHRLDRVTSGILILAKDAEMASWLTQAFREQRVTKYYVGISARRGKKKQGWVKGEMVRGRRKSWYLSATTDGKASNYAVTRFFSAGLGSISDEHALPLQQEMPAAKTCLLFRPLTGKTHQLRVAAKSLGMPLLGDPVYRTSDAPNDNNFDGIRTFLHAAAIHISFPDNSLHENVTIWSAPPFGSLLWDETGAQEFSQTVVSLIQKHCDCPEILHAIKSSDCDSVIR